MKKRARAARRQVKKYLKLEKQEDGKQKQHSFQWLSLALLPAAYIFMYAYRVGQCFYLGIPIEVAPITINDFLQYLVPTVLFLLPALSISIILRNNASRKDNLLFIPTFFFTLTIICCFYSPSSVTQRPETPIWLFAAFTYFIMLLALQTRHIIKKYKNEETSKNQASFQLLFASLIILIWIYAIGSVPGLLIFFLAFSIILLIKTTSTNRDIAKITACKPIADSKIATRILTVTIILSLALFSIMLIGFVAEEIKVTRPTLILTQDKTSLTYDDENALCILIMESDHVAICTPANKEGDSYWIPSQNNSFLNRKPDIRIIDISAENSLIKPDACTVRQLKYP